MILQPAPLTPPRHGGQQPLVLRQRAQLLSDRRQQSHMEGRPTASRITVAQSTPTHAALTPYIFIHMSARISTGTKQLAWQPGCAALNAAGIRTLKTAGSGSWADASQQPARLLVCNTSGMDFVQHVHRVFDKGFANISGCNCPVPLLLDSYGTEGVLLNSVHPHVPVTKWSARAQTIGALPTASWTHASTTLGPKSSPSPLVHHLLPKHTNNLAARWDHCQVSVYFSKSVKDTGSMEQTEVTRLNWDHWLWQGNDWKCPRQTACTRFQL